MSAYSDKIIADGATAYWRLGEASGTTASDSIGSAHGTISGGVTLGQSGALAGDSDKAMALNGTTAKIVTASMTLPVPMTIEAWIKTTALGAYRPLVTSNGTEVFFGLTDTGTLVIYTDGNAITVSSRAVADGQFHHVVYRSTGTQAMIYIDGVQDGATGAETRTATTGLVGIGFRQFNNTYFSGTLDEVAIYPTALTAVQIAAHYNLGRTNFPAGSYPAKVVSDGASAFWRLGETSGTTAVEVIGGANGTISGGVTLGQAGALADGDKAMLFDGATPSKIAVAGLQNYPFGTGPVTVEWWMRTTKPNAGSVFILDSGSALSGAGFHTYMTAANFLIFAVNTGAVREVTSLSAINNNQWRHVVGILERRYDGTKDRLRLFLDGVLNNAIDLVTPGGSLTSPDSFFMGGYTTGAAPTNYIGDLDDIAIYPTALTAPQIAAHYAAREFTSGVGFPGIPWWIPLDEGEVAVPFNVWEPITPHDTTDINVDGSLTDAILVGGAGDVAAVMQNKQVVVLKGLPAGAFVPIAARRVNATGTTATNLSALYQD